MEQQFNPSAERSPGAAPVVLRRVTRGYVRGIVLVAAVVALSLVIAAWGLSSFLLDANPGGETAGVLVLPVTLLLATVAAVPCWWQQALSLLRGNPRIARLWLLFELVLVAVITVAGRMVAHTELFAALNVFTLEVVLAFLVAHLVFWMILFRQIYTVKGRPLWPWEMRDSRVTEIAQLQQMWDRS